MPKAVDRRTRRETRRLRVRKKIHGTAERPRLSVFRSLKHIYVQIIDDDRGVTLAAASTLSPELRGKVSGGVEAAAAVGKLLAEKATARGISRVVFDRAGYKYHGRVKALAEALREGGLEF
ncbi:50S ribosomal protein L18 [Desulfothermobacter acidiphilus]|uniref:50S ribosomal protein L18 n=1 Tax=Desulfothermobacter acidiphilus TaxID=1938353 RepID=UPI003F8B0EE3